MTQKKTENTQKTCITPEEYKELKVLLEKNLKNSQKVLDQTANIRRSMYWAQIATTIRLFIIATPFVLAYLYFVPFLQDHFDKILELLSKLRV